MTATSLDFSQKRDLLTLAHVTSALQAVTVPAGLDFFLMGAAARDLMLRHAYNIEPQRLTEDVDFAVMVRDWETFEALRSGLVASGHFVARPGSATQRLRFKDGLPLDIVPFGGIERADRTIAWPPDHQTIYDCFGAREAFDTSVLVSLPHGVQLRVASIPALALLKVTAWQDRKYTHPGQDAPDLLLYLKTYLDCGNLDRATSAHQDLFDAEAYDYEAAGARLLARDLLKFLDQAAIHRVLEILSPEAVEEGRLLLAQQSDFELETARRLVAAFCEELARTR